MSVMNLRQLEVQQFLVDLPDILVCVVQHEDVLVNLCVQESLVLQDTRITLERFFVLLCLFEGEGLLEPLVEALISELLRDASGLPHSLVGLANTKRQNRL